MSEKRQIVYNSTIHFARQTARHNEIRENCIKRKDKSCLEIHEAFYRDHFQLTEKCVLFERLRE